MIMSLSVIKHVESLKVGQNVRVIYFYTSNTFLDSIANRKKYVRRENSAICGAMFKRRLLRIHFPKFSTKRHVSILRWHLPQCCDVVFKPVMKREHVMLPLFHSKSFHERYGDSFPFLSLAVSENQECSIIIGKSFEFVCVRSFHVRSYLCVSTTRVNLYGGHNSPDFTEDYLVIYWEGGHDVCGCPKNLLFIVFFFHLLFIRSLPTLLFISNAYT